jgi:hypothetical protein
MRFYGLCGAAAALSLALGSHVVAAVAADQPTAVNIVFDHKHLSNIEQGRRSYKFNRTVRSAASRQPFSDVVTLKVVAAKPTGERAAICRSIPASGARSAEAAGLTINPVFNCTSLRGEQLRHAGRRR